VTVSLKSLWDIEWDYDYGYVLISTDGGNTYTSAPSANGYTTPATQNPNAISCQSQYGNGLTGTSGSAQAGTQALDRVLGEYPPSDFIPDEFDISSAAGQSAVLRFSYSTDAGLARNGWFIDDLTVTAGSEVIYQTDFEDSAQDPRIFNGGCREDLRSAPICTDGWSYVNSSADSPADHAYYMELRDRSGFDFDSHGQNNREPLAFEPGLLLVYTDEQHGYGNFGTDDPPAQSPVDAVPTPGENAPNLNDAAFTAAAARKHYSDAAPGYVDNYLDENDANWTHNFDCLTFDVLSMTGDDIGPATSPGNLTATVQFDLGAGCAPFDYGFTDVANGPPTAAPSFRPSAPRAGEPVTFDGSASFDDITSPNGLTYDWDFDGDGAFDGSGQSISHTFLTAGTHQVTLRVTDSGGKTDSATMPVTVLAPTPSPSPTPSPTQVITPTPTATAGPSGQTPAPTKTPKPPRTPRPTRMPR
jgi:PKD repeat protein